LYIKLKPHQLVLKPNIPAFQTGFKLPENEKNAPECACIACGRELLTYKHKESAATFV